MTRHLSKDIPYRNTTIPYGRTQLDIDEMLKEAGVIAFRWTETPDSVKGLALPILEFQMSTIMGGKEEKFRIGIQAPLLDDQKRDRYTGKIIKTPNRNASMRLLYWYLKSRLEAVKFGLEDIFDAFMSRVINSLPDGRIVTLGETLKQYPSLVKELPTFEVKILPANSGDYK